MVSLHLWWITPLVLAGVIAIWLGGRALRKSTPPQDTTWVANSSFVRQLPEYQKQQRIYVLLRRVLAGSLALAVGAAALLAGRPVNIETRVDVLANRDIVLCLDVSGSMIPFDAEVVETFVELVDSFAGERIALSVFNSTSRLIFPLTDDYQLVKEQLTLAHEALSFDIYSLNPSDWNSPAAKQLEEFLEGTMGVQDSASLIGDGLAWCALQFDQADSERSRSIILATDNEVQGTAVYSLPEAAELAASRDITLIGLYAAPSFMHGQAEHREYQRVFERHDGLFYSASDPDAVDKIVENIQAQQLVDMESDPETIITDTPFVFFIVLLVGLAVFIVVVWRLRE